MKLKILFWLTIAIIIISNSCKKNDVIKINDSENFLIFYSRSSSWVDYNYTATINQNGLLQINDHNSISKQYRNSTYKLSISELKLVSNRFHDVCKIDISDKYGFDMDYAPTDLSTTSLRYKTFYKSDTTSIYFPREHELPAELDTFLRIIEQVFTIKDTLRI
jgi:hypothetical protein